MAPIREVEGERGGRTGREGEAALVVVVGRVVLAGGEC